jgi:hypothetical protein
VLGAFLKFGGIDWFNYAWSETHGAEVLGLVMFALLAAYILWDSLRATEE